ncbi:MAG: tRNA pseudouridine(55) synthase TruB [Gammaproteobacteria bacterium CG11_big_fil_rev_8_21_14_0_20_46_22]|nr:MAG: tRNA pseudouridine(55) synthase TruB [Gammaproteobacteria bacterium CG12_big_fil_rev_8_21_14_0_65_46_12]PIR10695.1 MAG: tRNA pseudouridine(55) synthase TruB [Gammaproteobacteria bacterium CG11_big_fil_rev_8_21_14_0_20_46_22]
MENIDGVLILDKPQGMSSNQAMQKVRRLFQAKKAGHTGSLDVLATGLLPVCFGQATKYAQYLLDADKAYRVQAKLGVRTDSGDAEGEVIDEQAIDATEDAVKDVVDSFLGDIEQVPPMHSALKHKGQPLYKLARKGLSVERKSRSITIYSLSLIDYSGDSLTLDVHCSKGTYIRTLIDDMGLKLGCGAHVQSLRRLQAGPFKADQMLSLDKLETIKEQKGIEALRARLLPVEVLLEGIMRCDLDAESVAKLRHGQKVSPASHAIPAKTLVRIYQDDAFKGLARTDDERVLAAKRMLA